MELLYEFVLTAIISVLFAFLLGKLFSPDHSSQETELPPAHKSPQEEEEEEEEKIIEVDAVGLREEIDPIGLRHHEIMEEELVEEEEELVDEKRKNNNGGLVLEERIVDVSPTPREFVGLELKENKEEEQILQVEENLEQEQVVVEPSQQQDNLQGEEVIIIAQIESQSHVLDQQEEEEEQSVTKLAGEVVEIAQEKYFEDEIGIALPKDQDHLVLNKKSTIGIGDDMEMEMEIDGWVEINRSEVEKRFDKAKAFAGSDGAMAGMSKLGSDVQLHLHALHNVAMEGPFHDSSNHLSLSLSQR